MCFLEKAPCSPQKSVHGGRYAVYGLQGEVSGSGDTDTEMCEF